MIEKSLKRYKLYEYIRDNELVTENISNTKKLITNLIDGDLETIEFCNNKVLEELKEIEDATLGIHFHKNMTKREILVNEISQYMYWITIIAISKKIPYEQFDLENRIKKILTKIDISKIGEYKNITLDEIIQHDLDEMYKKDYLKEVIDK